MRTHHIANVALTATAIAAATITAAHATPPQPTPAVVAPLKANPASPALVKVTDVFNTMTATVYSHKYVENTTTGYYAWDCVGMTDWVLHQSTPNAWTAMHTTLSIRPGYVPSPTRWYQYLTGGNGKLPASWKRVTNIKGVAPGTYLLFPKHSKTRFVGHAVIAAGKPQRMTDGSYALRVYDSTGTPHGPSDTRHTDPRTGANPPTTIGSGLGNGTMRLYVTATGALKSARWSINAGGPAMKNVPVAAGIARN